MAKLPEHLETKRTYVTCKADAAVDTESIKYFGAYNLLGVENGTVENFFSDFKVEVIDIKEDEIEFDMIGIDAALANAFRRILIAEVPTMAIEKVLVANNTSLVQDEVLAHRLGLIPLRVDPRLFAYKSEKDEPNEQNTIVFGLHARCEQTGARLTVKSEELKWLPEGSLFELGIENKPSDSTSKPKTYTNFKSSQESLHEFSENPIRPHYHDITIARLGQGQEIELEAHAVKGVGKEHAKWSPVSTAWYRMLPEVVLLQDIYDDKADELVERCPANVFDIEDTPMGRKATAPRARSCTLCRECVMGEGWDEFVALRRKRDHFIFRIEATGALSPADLFTEAVKILEEKCARTMRELSC